MSDSKDSTVTYMEAPPSPDYVPGPKEPEQTPPLSEFVPEPVYPEFMPLKDEILPAEEHQLPAADSLITDLPRYIPESDPEEDPADYHTDRGYDDDDDDESSDDDEDDDDVQDDEDKDEEEEEEEHPALADSIPPPPVHRVTARMSIRDQPPTPFWSEEKIDILLAIPSPLSLWSSPLSPCPTYPLRYRDAMIRLRAEIPYTSYPPLPIVLPHTRASVAMLRAAAPSTYILAPQSETPPLGIPPLLLIPLPTSSPPLLLPFTSRREDVLEVTLPPQKKLCITLGMRFKVCKSSSTPTARPMGGFRADYGFVSSLYNEIRQDPEREVGYEITDTWDEMLVGMPGALAADETELDRRMKDFSPLLDETLMRFMGDWTMPRMTESRVEFMSLRTTMLAHQAEIAGLWAIDHTRQTQLTEALTLLRHCRHRWQHCKDDEDPLEVQYSMRYRRRPATKMAPKRTTSLTPAITTPTTTTTSVSDAQLKALIDKGVAKALAAHDADRSQNGKDNHDSRMDARRQAPPARECTYQDFMKCKPLYFKGTEGVVELTQWGEIKQLEVELWNLKVKGTDMVTYNQRFQELVLMCARMFPKESDKIERYIDGLPDMIHGSVMASKPNTMQDIIEFTIELMEKKISTFAERQAKNKRKFEDISKNNQNQQQNKRQNWQGYAAGSSDKKHYRGQKPTCFKCGSQRHFKRECPKLKNNNRGNPTRNGNALVKVYAVGYVGTNPDSNVVIGTLLLNNRYASILFDTGADKSFVSTVFNFQIDITPTTLDHYYDVELADGRIIGLNTIIQGFCWFQYLDLLFDL
nr:hypothetical protein [Tanacetum cinerariifolium]